MKKIINNKKYDTDTARKIGCWSSGSNPSDFSYYDETLYCKRSGEYFLLGDGGPASRYSKRTDSNTWSGSCEIIPLSYQDATQWAMKHLNADIYENEFGDVSEDDGKGILSVSLPLALIENVRRRAKEEGISVSAYVKNRLSGDMKVADAFASVTEDVSSPDSKGVVDRAKRIRKAEAVSSGSSGWDGEPDGQHDEVPQG